MCQHNDRASRTVAANALSRYPRPESATQDEAGRKIVNLANRLLPLLDLPASEREALQAASSPKDCEAVAERILDGFGSSVLAPRSPISCLRKAASKHAAGDYDNAIRYVSAAQKDAVELIALSRHPYDRSLGDPQDWYPGQEPKAELARRRRIENERRSLYAIDI